MDTIDDDGDGDDDDELLIAKEEKEIKDIILASTLPSGHIYEIDFSYHGFKVIPGLLFEIESLPETLASLNLADNNLTELDTRILGFKHLNSLNLRYNSLISLPSEIQSNRIEHSIKSVRKTSRFDWTTEKIIIF